MAKDKEGSFTVRYTNKDIIERIEQQHDTLGKVLEQTKITNGRVNMLEKRSLGMWIANNPFKFAIFLLIFIAMVISDIRHPIIGLLTSLI